MKITNIKGREILDSRGNPTIEVDLYLNDLVMGRASVPSGASTGIYEAYELRDNDITRYLGKGVNNAVNNINNEIKNLLINKEITNQEELDNLLINLDGTKNKSRLGANAILGVSLAFAKAAAKLNNQPLYQYLSKNDKKVLPIPMMNILNGGAHASNNIDIQEFMIMPISAKSFKEALRMSTEVFHTLKLVLKEDNIFFNGVGDEGGYAPNLKEDEDAFKLIVRAIERAGYTPKKDFLIAIDAASSEWYNEKLDNYHLPKSNKIMSKEELVYMWEYLVSTYPIYSIEDGIGETDYEGWKLLTNALKDKVQLVGDDLFVTNKERLEMGIKEGIANAILIKPNQIGTLTETLETIELAQKNGLNTIISHRSGETDDTSIAHIAVATNAGQIKSGAPSRMDRITKYNELLRIEEELQNNSKLYNLGN